VQRLAAAGLVATDRARVRPTRRAKRLLRQSGRWRPGGSRAVTPRIEAALKERVPFPLQPTAWALSEEAWHEAYERYDRS
jgi:hypothetical protein